MGHHAHHRPHRHRSGISGCQQGVLGQMRVAKVRELNLAYAEPSWGECERRLLGKQGGSSPRGRLNEKARQEALGYTHRHTRAGATCLLGPSAYAGQCWAGS